MEEILKKMKALDDKSSDLRDLYDRENVLYKARRDIDYRKCDCCGALSPRPIKPAEKTELEDIEKERDLIRDKISALEKVCEVDANEIENDIMKLFTGFKNAGLYVEVEY